MCVSFIVRLIWQEVQLTPPPGLPYQGVKFWIHAYIYLPILSEKWRQDGNHCPFVPQLLLRGNTWHHWEIVSKEHDWTERAAPMELTADISPPTTAWWPWRVNLLGSWQDRPLCHISSVSVNCKVVFQRTQVYPTNIKTVLNSHFWLILIWRAHACVCVQIHETRTFNADSTFLFTFKAKWDPKKDGRRRPFFPRATRI